MDTDLPRRFVLYRGGVGIIGHGVEFPDGGIALRRVTATILYRDMAAVWEAWCLPGPRPFPETMIVQYDDESAA